MRKLKNPLEQFSSSVVISLEVGFYFCSTTQRNRQRKPIWYILEGAGLTCNNVNVHSASADSFLVQIHQLVTTTGYEKPSNPWEKRGCCKRYRILFCHISSQQRNLYIFQNDISIAYIIITIMVIKL